MPIKTIPSDFVQTGLKDQQPHGFPLEPITAPGSVSMFGGPVACGKTRALLQMAAALACGEATKPLSVLFVDVEIGAEIGQRLRTIADYFTPDQQTLIQRNLRVISVPSLPMEQVQRVIDDTLGKGRTDGQVLVLDNISMLVANDDRKAWEDFFAWIRGHKAKGLATLIVHRLGKASQQRGTAIKMVAVIDNVFVLEPTKGGHPDALTIRCVKGRNLDELAMKTTFEFFPNAKKANMSHGLRN